jgi:phosphoglycolate phosphatase
VGDAKRDIEAGNSAGTTTLVAMFGYVVAEDRPEEWEADGHVDHPSEILGWLEINDKQ